MKAKESNRPRQTKKKQIAKTYGELAKALGLKGSDPERMIQKYLQRGMPGRPATPGKANGRFDVDVCRAWIQANVKRSGALVGDRFKELQERILLLDLEIKEAQRLEQLERLADVDELAMFMATCINNAKAIIEGIPDVVLSMLPQAMKDAERARIHRDITKLIDTSFEELAKSIEGDTDPTD